MKIVTPIILMLTISSCFNNSDICECLENDIKRLTAAIKNNDPLKADSIHSNDCKKTLNSTESFIEYSKCDRIEDLKILTVKNMEMIKEIFKKKQDSITLQLHGPN